MASRNEDFLTEHEESYFVSMTDLMVGMLFIFIIMLMSFALSYTKSKIEVEERDIQVHETRTKMLEQIREQLEREGLTVIINEKNGVIRLREGFQFKSGKASLTREMEKNLKTLSKSLSNVVPCYAKHVSESSDTMKRKKSSLRCKKTTHFLEAIFVEGHTDNVPMGKSDFDSNLELSAFRAMSTYEKLIEYEPTLAKIMNEKKQPIFSVSGYGEERPLNNNDTEDERRLNRRIDLRFIMALPKLPEAIRVIESKISDDNALDAPIPVRSSSEETLEP